MKSNNLAKVFEEAANNDWTIQSLRPCSSQEVDDRYPLALVVQTAAQLLNGTVKMDGGEASNCTPTAAQCQSAVDTALTLIRSAFSAREQVKISLRDFYKTEAEALRMPVHLPFEKGVRYITNSRSLEEKLSAFKEWLRWIWINDLRTFFDEHYPEVKQIIESAGDPSTFEQTALAHWKMRGFSSFAAVDLRERFEQYYQFRTLENKIKAGKTRAERATDAKTTGKVEPRKKSR